MASDYPAGCGPLYKSSFCVCVCLCDRQLDRLQVSGKVKNNNNKKKPKTEQPPIYLYLQKDAALLVNVRKKVPLSGSKTLRMFRKVHNI